MKTIGSGQFVDVASVDNLPPELQAKVSEGSTGYVIKKYKKDKYARLFKNPKDIYGSGDEYLRLGAEDKVKILEKRQEFVRAFFKDVLPDLVVRSSYVLGEKSKDASEIYELQPKIETAISVQSLDYDKKAFEALSISARHNLLNQLKLFIEKAREMPGKSEGFMIDIFGGNIVVLPDGNLKMLDTNLFFYVYDDGYMGETMEETYNVSLRTIERIIDKLSAG